MSAKKKTTDIEVTVPASAGDEVWISYAGDEPIAYPVTNGTVHVQAEHLANFLGAVEGSTVRSGTAANPEE